MCLSPSSRVKASLVVSRVDQPVIRNTSLYTPARISLLMFIFITTCYTHLYQQAFHTSLTKVSIHSIFGLSRRASRASIFSVYPTDSIARKKYFFFQISLIYSLKVPTIILFDFCLGLKKSFTPFFCWRNHFRFRKNFGAKILSEFPLGKDQKNIPSAIFWINGPL